MAQPSVAAPATPGHVTRPIRVVAVLPDYPPSSMVGSWLTTHEYLRHLAARGHDVEVVRYLGIAGHYTHEGIHVVTGAGHIETKVATADVVLSHLGDNHRAARAAAAEGIPNVRLAHGHGAEPDRLEGAALVIFNSAAFRDTVTDWHGPSIVAHPPVLPERYQVTPGDRVTLVNLTEAKGVRTFWRCAERLPAVRFLGVRGGYGHQIEPRARNVEVIPTTTDMRTVYARTSVLLMPSEHETYGRVAIEAAVSGIPTVAHPTTGLTEALGPAGVFVDRDDIDGWVDAITRLSDPDRYAAASAGARLWAARLDPAAQLDIVADAIEAAAVRAPVRQ
jgi:glycosyltransferase involved in cell wall biosynthesis